jgi:hypothetical protein
MMSVTMAKAYAHTSALRLASDPLAFSGCMTNLPVVAGSL